MTQTLHIRKVAVLGAGVMGAQIAAHCVNARVPVVLFDLPAEETQGRSQVSLNPSAAVCLRTSGCISISIAHQRHANHQQEGA